MTAVPLPESPCVRFRCIWNEGGVGEGGIRSYISYTGSAPSAANCATLATDISNLWNTNFLSLCPTSITMDEVDVLDIASASGLSAQVNPSWVGTRAGTPLPVQCALNVESLIARRYRGGKPRSFFPFGVTTDLLNEANWTSAFLSTVNTAVSAFYAGIAALSIGSMGTLAHVNLSYYSGFTNITNSSGRERAVPKYKATATLDAISGYAAKSRIGSQKRRRSSTTP